MGDNPNILIAREHAWEPQDSLTGKDYLALMAQRVQQLKLKTAFTGPISEMTIGGLTFFSQEAVNTIQPEVPTTQRYLCTYKDDYFIIAILSHNGPEDPDTKVMMLIPSPSPRSRPTMSNKKTRPQNGRVVSHYRRKAFSERGTARPLG